MSKYDLKLDLMKDSEVELIKDFLSIKGFRRTLECFIKEEKYKSIEDRNIKVSSNNNYNTNYIYVIFAIYINRQKQQI